MLHFTHRHPRKHPRRLNGHRSHPKRILHQLNKINSLKMFQIKSFGLNSGTTGKAENHVLKQISVNKLGIPFPFFFALSFFFFFLRKGSDGSNSSDSKEEDSDPEIPSSPLLARSFFFFSLLCDFLFQGSFLKQKIKKTFRLSEKYSIVFEFGLFHSRVVVSDVAIVGFSVFVENFPPGSAIVLDGCATVAETVIVGRRRNVILPLSVATSADKQWHQILQLDFFPSSAMFQDFWDTEY